MLIVCCFQVTKKFGVPGLKVAMEWFGYYGGPVRSPLQPITTEQEEIMRAVFKLSGFVHWEACHYPALSILVLICNKTKCWRHCIIWSPELCSCSTVLIGSLPACLNIWTLFLHIQVHNYIYVLCTYMFLFLKTEYKYVYQIYVFYLVVLEFMYASRRVFNAPKIHLSCMKQNTYYIGYLQ